MASAFSRAEYIPLDSIFDVTRRYVADAFADKVNLGQGTYRDGNGQPWVLPAVRGAEEVVRDSGHEYLAIDGLKAFRDEAVKMAFHGTKALAEERIASCQSVSGTGALLLAAMALRKAQHPSTAVYITDPTWSNHALLFASQGFAVHTLPYYKAGALDFAGYLAALEAAEAGAVVVLHACAHNPTGCDPSQAQWAQVAAVVQRRGLLPVFDAAYLGFNSGSVDADAWAVRYFVDTCGLEAFVCLSFAKSMGLYGERIGLAAFVAATPALARTAASLLVHAQRATISSPPVHGARLAAAVLGTPALRAQWALDLQTMSGRIRAMRQALFSALGALQTPGDWSHLIHQTGMFGYLGLTSAQVQHLEKQYHIYMAETSRISIAGLNDSNVQYVAKALDETVRTVS